MIIYIENITIDPRTFVVPPMSLSSSRAKMKQHDFECKIPKSGIVELMRSEYDQWVTESKEDDAQFDEPQDELGVAGYPDIDTILESKELSELVFGNYLVRELFEKLNSNSDSDNFNYWFDEVTDCVIKDDYIILKGSCCSKIS